MSQGKRIALSSLALMMCFLISCSHKPKDVLGCMDATATNYDPKATIESTCKYKSLNQQYEGTYCVKDTLVNFDHDMSRGWYDTIASAFTIKVMAVTKDSLAFDTILTMSAAYPAGFRFYDNCNRFSYDNGQPYHTLVGSGEFSGDTLRYSEVLSPMPTSRGYVARWGTGIRYTK